MSLDERMDALAAAVVAREARHADELQRAREKAEALHGRVAAAVARFNAAVAEDVPGLQIDVSPPRLDDKHTTRSSSIWSAVDIARSSR